MASQPRNQLVEGNAIASTDYDNLSPAELQRLINEAHRIRTGRTGNVHSSAPPPQKQVVNLERFLGGL
jgi:hypothetical protein